MKMRHVDDESESKATFVWGVKRARVLFVACLMVFFTLVKYTHETEINAAIKH